MSAIRAVPWTLLETYNTPLDKDSLVLGTLCASTPSAFDLLPQSQLL